MKLYKNRDWLYQKYWIEQLSMPKIAKLFECCDETLRKWMIKFNINRRNRSDVMLGKLNPLYGKKHSEKAKMAISQKNKGKKRSAEVRKKLSRLQLKQYENKYHSRGWLYNQYIEKHLTMEKIANICDVGVSTIFTWIHRFNIKSRGRDGILSKEKKEGFQQTYRNENWLKNKYINNKLSIPEIARLCSCSNSVVGKWLRKFDIRTRDGKYGFLGKKHTKKSLKKMKENHKDMKGENNYQWKGGISFEPYTPEFNTELKKQIRERDKYQCQFCGTRQNGRKFPIHHINYNKKDNRPINLITMCDFHHRKTTSNRDKWQMSFEAYQELRRNYVSI